MHVQLSRHLSEARPGNGSKTQAWAALYSVPLLISQAPTMERMLWDLAVTTGTTDLSLNYPCVWPQPMALHIYFLLLSMKTLLWQFPILWPSSPPCPHHEKYLDPHFTFQFPDLEAEQSKPALMEKTLVHSGFTLDPGQFRDISQLLYIYFLSCKSQQKLASTLLALKYKNTTTVKPENQFLVGYLQTICSKTVPEVHLSSAKFK